MTSNQTVRAAVNDDATDTPATPHAVHKAVTVACAGGTYYTTNADDKLYRTVLGAVGHEISLGVRVRLAIDRVPDHVIDAGYASASVFDE